MAGPILDLRAGIALAQQEPFTLQVGPIDNFIRGERMILGKATMMRLLHKASERLQSEAGSPVTTAMSTVPFWNQN
ncbi:hypothetical protein NKH74_16925 [Mesorhizobium sp. M0933]|uniref:hypothetical protein n=1 Tax=Mesorhizobium sp. M0933 TaxID=2957030 RepID=UPI00333BB4E0